MALLEYLAKGLIPANTCKSTMWALKVFNLWKQARNQSHPEDPVLDELLTTNDLALLNTHLSCFPVEARKVNGDLYPQSAIHQLSMWLATAYERHKSWLS